MPPTWLVALLLVPAMAATRTAPVPTPGGAPGAPASQLAAPPREQQARSGTAILRGRVVAADSGRPMRKSQVHITSTTPTSHAGLNLPQQRMTTTDAEGRYEFKELPAGRYNVTASKGSYISLSYGQR